jgi:hypothetical protein
MQHWIKLRYLGQNGVEYTRNKDLSCTTLTSLGEALDMLWIIFVIKYFDIGSIDIFGDTSGHIMVNEV